MSSSDQGLFGHFQTSDNRRMRDYGAIVPKNTEAELFTISVLRKLVLLLIPGFTDSKWVLHPWLPAQDSSHKCFDAGQADGERPHNGGQ